MESAQSIEIRLILFFYLILAWRIIFDLNLALENAYFYISNNQFGNYLRYNLSVYNLFKCKPNQLYLYK